MEDLTAFSSQLRQQIETFEQAHGYALGWRLLASPAEVLNGAQIAFIGLHPGGRVRPPDHPDFAPASGSAYVEESWAGHAPGESLLQKQVRALFSHLRVTPESVLTGNLVPFRSPSWAELPHRQAALRFGADIWKTVLQRASPRLIICTGHEAFDAMFRMLGAEKAVSVPVGWGNVSGAHAMFRGGALVRLPHLSRFRIITREESQEGLRQIFGVDWHK